MAVFKNTNPTSAITSVEFTPVTEGNFTFFYVKNPRQTDDVKHWLKSQLVKQEIIAETSVNGVPTLITQGDQSRDDIMAALATRGDKMALYKKTPEFSEVAWPLRSALGITGQALQLLSSVMRGKGTDWHLFAFSLSNLTANGINLIFGAQKTPDDHRLRFLKNEINHDLSFYLPKGEKLPSPDEHRLPKEERKPGAAVHRTLKNYSVTIGELGLRYFGAFSIASDTNSPLRSRAGWGSITGKTIALFSKAPDPYNTKPPSLLDTLREKFTFRFGGLVEAASFATLAFDGFKNQTITFPDKTWVPLKLRGQKRADYLSALGAAMFTAAYIIRTWAPYGVKELDTDELYAHVADSLAHMPPEKLPQLIADTAALVKEHRHDDRIPYGRIYTRIATDLYRYHHITLQNTTQPAQNAPQQENTPAVIPFATQHTSRKPAVKAAPEASHAAKIQHPGGETASIRL